MPIKIFYIKRCVARCAFLFLLLSCTDQPSAARLKHKILPGAYQTNEYFSLIGDRATGIVANHTSLIGNVHLVDSLVSSGFKVKCVFAPEHGFRGEKGAGEVVEGGIDAKSGIRIVSLYGNRKKPAAADLKGIEVIIFDIQDVGVRFYTYISTLQYVMEACAENDIELIVLDRPNPNGFYIDGPVLEEKHTSFVGMQRIPVVYGMTIGEYALMLNGEGMLKNMAKCRLKVVSNKNYFHASKYVLPVAPSPNLPDMDAVYLYPSVCFFEGTAISLGRGTEKPFRLIGFPSAELDTNFTPRSIRGVAVSPPYMDTLCSGIDLSGQGINIAAGKKIELRWLAEMYKLYPDKKKFFNSFFEKLAGNSALRKQIEEGKSAEEIRKTWQPGIEKFKEVRKKYLLYVDFEE